MIEAIAIGLGLLVVLALFGLPLALRGPVLRALARHESKSLCGTVEIAGGHLGVNAVVGLISQRPFDVALDGVRIREPEGDDLFRANTVRLRIKVLRKPWRVVVERAHIADGAWRLVNRREGELLTAALEPLPATGRGSCRVPASEPEQQRRFGSLVRIEAVTLQDVSLVLSFPDWAVTLDALDALGTLEARGTPDGVQVLFDARDVRTRKHGLLRIGPAAQPTTFEVPFDSVEISRVAVTDAAPFDLRLSVAAARTRGARLTGEATFTDVFAPESTGRSAGMILSARWSELGQALARNPSWADVGRRLALLHMGVRTSLRGPFDALTGSADVDGKGLSLRARLLPHQRYTLDATFRALDTRPLLARAQRSSLGGRLDGHFAVTAQLGRAPRTRSITLDDIALVLQREPAGDGLPRRWVVEHIGSDSSPPRSSGGGDVRVALGTVALQGDEIVVDPVRVQAPGAAIAASLRGGFAKSTWLRARIAPDSRATFRGETFRLPPRLDIDSNARHDVTIAPFAIANVAGGTVGVAGSIRHDGPLALRATVTRYPLVHLPGVARAHVPGQSAPLGRLLGGSLDADLKVGGTARSPSLAGQVAFNDLRWDRQPIGDGAIRFDAVDGGTRFAGRLMSGVDLDGKVTKSHGASLHARLALAELQRALPALRVRRATGTIAADVDVPGGGAEAAARADASISWTQPLSIWPARLPVAIEVQPARITLHDDQLTLTRLVARAAGVQATLAGRMRVDRADAGASPLTATLDVAADGRALGASLGAGSHVTGSGTADLGATLTGSLRALRVHAEARVQGLTVDWPGSPVGAIRLDGPLTIEGPVGGTAGGPQLVIGPLLARLTSGGWIIVAGAHGPGRVDLALDRSPLPVSNVDLLVRGSGLTTRHAIAGVSLHGLALALALAPRDPHAQTLRLTGSVNVGYTSYHLGGGGQGDKTSKSPAAHHPNALDRIWADNVQLVGPHDAVKAKVSYVPTVTVGVRCTLNGPLAAPRVAGQVKGAGAYSKFALMVADWFTARKLRQCDFGPH